MTATAARSKERLMFRFILAALQVFPWLLNPEREITPPDDGDNRNTIDPNG